MASKMAEADWCPLICYIAKFAERNRKCLILELLKKILKKIMKLAYHWVCIKEFFSPK